MILLYYIIFADWKKVRDATIYLHSHVIPDFARKLLSDDYQHVNEDNVVSEMHRAGINARHLGLMRTRVLESGPGRRRRKLVARILLVCLAVGALLVSRAD